MVLHERVLKVFREVLEIRGEVRTSDLHYNETPHWDSLGHITLVAALESEFDIMIDTDEVLAMNSYDKALEIVQSHSVAA